jgi:PIN domain nuclease of toxin-antitoxin system
MSGLLLDTHVFLWYASADTKLSSSAISRIRSEPGKVYLSLASAWEISIKAGLGKLELHLPLSELLGQPMLDDGIELLNLTAEDVVSYTDLRLPESGHRDPFDRILVVQTQLRDLSLMTADRAFLDYNIPVELI